MIYDYNKRNQFASTPIVGNEISSDKSLGYKTEVKEILEGYSATAGGMANAFYDVLSNPLKRSQFEDAVSESIVTSPLLTNKELVNEPFYNNYADRFRQLMDNSLKTMAIESVMTGYSPIQAYSPFILKDQWVNNVYKDILMTEIPSSPIIQLCYEKRYLVSQAGKRYPIPEVNYNDELMNELYDEATGLKIDSNVPVTLPAYNETVLDPKYVPGLIVTPNTELTQNITICKIELTDGVNTYERPVNIRIDVADRGFQENNIRYEVKDENGVVTDTIEDSLIGSVDFDNGKITVVSSQQAGTKKITKVYLSGNISNRWNERSIDVERKAEKYQYTMPESGPRINSAIALEEAADALAIGNIDKIADDIDVGGRTLAEFEDMKIRKFLMNSYFVQKKFGPNNKDYGSTLVYDGNFNTTPYQGYSGTISTYLKEDFSVTFNRVIQKLKEVLRTERIQMTAICAPELMQYITGSIDWVTSSNDSEIGGMRLNYNLGIMNSNGDRIHIVTSMYNKAEEGITILVLPLTSEIITYKHYKYNVMMDKGYRHPVRSLVPNIMMTQRTLDIEITPVQGRFYVDGRQMKSPTTLERPQDVVIDPADPANFENGRGYAITE